MYAIAAIISSAKYFLSMKNKLAGVTTYIIENAFSPREVQNFDAVMMVGLDQLRDIMSWSVSSAQDIELFFYIHVQRVVLF